MCTTQDVHAATANLGGVKQWWKFVRWLWSTPWPIYALTTLQSHLAGAVFVFAFLRFGLPVGEFLEIGDFRFVNQYIFVGALVFSFTVGTMLSTWLIFPVLKASRRPDPFPDPVRQRALNMPVYQSGLQGAIWAFGITVFVLVNLSVSQRLALIVGITATLGGAMACIISYLQAERIMRPITRRALAEGVPQNRHLPGVRRRIYLGWLLSTALPVLGILLILLGSQTDIFGEDVHIVNRAVGMLALATLVAGALGMQLVSTAVADPVRDLQAAMRRVQAGDFSTRTVVYDASEMGRLQVGFNEMVAELQERETMQDLFGRYVGEDVVLHALENGTELGGTERTVGVLFVDLAGSTEFAMQNRPGRVVEILNEFFRTVVETVDDNGGYINKFQGDAALAIFGAPMEAADPAGQALRAARELGSRLSSLEPLRAGIGVSYGTVIAGHIGHARRFEYTVIGDPVNEASRLTSLAKYEQGGVLASKRAVDAADSEEADRWMLGRAVELRGRNVMTQLARPLRPTLADRWQAAHDLGLDTLPHVTQPAEVEDLLDDDQLPEDQDIAFAEVVEMASRDAADRRAGRTRGSSDVSGERKAAGFGASAGDYGDRDDVALDSVPVQRARPVERRRETDDDTRD